MKLFAICFILFSISCFSQQVTKEEFLNDILKSGEYYSVDDEDTNTTLIVEQCMNPSSIYNPFNSFLIFPRDSNLYQKGVDTDYIINLPDSCFKQMCRTARKDSGKVFQWNENLVKAPPGKNVFFVTGDEVDLLFDRYTKHDTSGSPEHKDSIAKRLKEIYAVKMKYHNATGVYNFERPIFDANYQYAIFVHTHFCPGLCGDGHYDLFEKINGHWQKIANGGNVDY